MCKQYYFFPFKKSEWCDLCNTWHPPAEDPKESQELLAGDENVDQTTLDTQPEPREKSSFERTLAETLSELWYPTSNESREKLRQQIEHFPVRETAAGVGFVALLKACSGVGADKEKERDHKQTAKPSSEEMSYYRESKLEHDMAWRNKMRGDTFGQQKRHFGGPHQLGGRLEVRAGVPQPVRTLGSHFLGLVTYARRRPKL